MPRPRLLPAFCLFLAPTAALALNGPSAISIDGGPLGSLSLSGGADGNFYWLSGAGEKNNGALLGNALVELQKTTGLVQFTVEAGAYSAETLGYNPTGTDYFDESPLYVGEVTFAPTSWLSVSAGQISPLVGYESSQDWSNASLYFSEVAYTQPAQGRGAEAAVTEGNFTATVSLTDGYYTKVLNYVQGIGTYTFDASNSVSVFGGGNFGRTGVNAQGSGNTLLDNSSLAGGFYTYSAGAVTLTPEVQVQYTPKAAALGLGGGVGALSTALFGTYAWANSQFSLGGFVEYASETYTKGASYSTTPDFFGFGPGASLYGLSLAPTWQHGNVFVRADAGLIHVHGAPSFTQGSGLLEGGVLF